MEIILEGILYLVGFFVPRSDKIWVFGGNHGLRYADNSMHFFRYCRRNKPGRLVWLTRSTQVLEEVRTEDCEVYLIGSIKGIWLGLRARWHIFDVGPTDTGPTSRGAMRLNLWHGIPLKNLASIKQKGKKFSELKILLRRILVRKSREYFVHPNRKYISHVLGVFHIPEKNVFIANLPRNEIFFNTVADAARVKSHDSLWRDRIQTLRNQGQMIVGYFPTWRSDGEDLFLGISEAKYINKLNEMLVENKLTIITKWHTCSYDEYQHDGRSHTAYKLDRAISSQSNILSLDFPTDLNSVLTHCDALVTDYSSVLFDFLFTDRPQFFVPYDLDRYCSSTGLLFDYESFVPGPVILDSSRLITAVSALREGKDVDIYSGRRAELRKTFFENEQCSSHIMKLMESIS